ncbi:MAG TPA: hypothetical protein PLP17_12650 [Oligoflexia bacterium]|nr:hypothetical protein [Oligoflexia bacterium]
MTLTRDQRRPINRCLQLIAAFAVFSWLIQSVAAQEKSPDKSSSESHFIDTWQPLTTLPAGADLNSVRSLLRKRILLRADINEEPLVELPPGGRLYAIDALPAGEIILRNQISSNFPAAIARLLPPHKQPITVRVKTADMRTAVLCSPFDPVSVSLDRPQADQAAPLQITRDARLLSYQTATEEDYYLAVVAVPDGAAENISNNAQQDIPVSLSCLRYEKYEETEPD